MPPAEARGGAPLSFAVLTSERLHVSPRGSVTGTLAVRVGTHAFPEEHWSDFVVVVLAAWLDRVDHVFGGRRRSTRCFFMDGPYWWQLRRAADGRWDASFYRGHTAAPPVVVGELNPAQTLRALVLAASVVLASPALADLPAAAAADVAALARARARADRTLARGLSSA